MIYLDKGMLTTRNLSPQHLQPLILALYTGAGDHRHHAVRHPTSLGHSYTCRQGLVDTAADVDQSDLLRMPPVCPPLFQPD
jgi:hypothetical protein